MWILRSPLHNYNLNFVLFHVIIIIYFDTKYVWLYKLKAKKVRVLTTDVRLIAVALGNGGARRHDVAEALSLLVDEEDDDADDN